MTKAEPVEEILSRIQSMYAEKPRGWRVMSTPRGDMLVLGPDSAFQLKMIPLNPQEFTGAGIELPNPQAALDSVKSSPEFGLRPLSDRDFEQIIQSLIQPDIARPSLESIIRRAPMSPLDLNSIKSSHLLTGPILARPDLASLSPEMSKLTSMLDKEAEKTFRERYPMRAGMYF